MDLVRWCRDATEKGDSVVLTCMGGLGRSGTLAACYLVGRGMSPSAAIASVRQARGPRALETIAQEDFITTFAGASRWTRLTSGASRAPACGMSSVILGY